MTSQFQVSSMAVQNYTFYMAVLQYTNMTLMLVIKFLY